MSRSRSTRHTARSPVAAQARPASSRLATLLDPRAPYLVPLVLLLASRAFFALRIAPGGEDALITFRYAWNFAQGHGAVFNPGERVFGYTSLPWMAWIALGIRLGSSALHWARASLWAADAVTLLAAASLLERHASRAAAWCFAIFFAAWPYFAALASTGLESGALLALVAGTAYLLDVRHPAAGAPLGVLAVFRPEGLLAAAVLALWARGRDRLLAAGIVVAALLALTIYYGSPVPQSVLAKAIVYGSPGPLHAQQWWLWLLPIPLARDSHSASEVINLSSLSLVLFPAALAGLPAVWARRRTPLAATIAGLGIIWLALLAVGATYFFWYLAAPLCAWALVASLGLPRLVRGWPVYAAIGIALAAHWGFEPRLYVGRANAEGGMFGAVGDYVATHARSGETLMLEPIGTIGWRCRSLRIVDETGLVTPKAASLRARGGEGWYADLVASYRPDWLVVRAGVIRGNVAFAGAGRPFRSDRERTATLAPYVSMAATDTVTTDQTLLVLRRGPGR